MPDVEDVREGVIVTRIAAHIADIAKGLYGAREQDRKMSESRTKLDWREMAKHALDQTNFKRLIKAECKNNPEISDGCSMCGKYCTEKKK